MNKLYVSSSPHIKDTKTTSSIMRNVVLALCPALIGSVLFFSLRALVIVGISVISCVLFEFLYNLILRRKQTIGDFSAVVTGMLLGFNLPVTVPIWLPVIGAAFAIIVIKMLFGGIGKNIVNPALGGRIFLFISFSSLMSTWIAPISAVDHSAASLPLFATPTDVVSSATPLAYLKDLDGNIVSNYSIGDAFLGTVGGCLGETSAILLIIGGLYLIYKKIITWHIPVSFLGTVAVITFLFPHFTDITRLEFMCYNLFGGGLMLGAIFMATDYTTSPITPKGKIIFGVGCGLLTVFIRYFGGYPEGVSFAIFLMNFFVWFIDQHTIPKKFGGKSNGFIFKRAKK